jgi:hypothetical protein
MIRSGLWALLAVSCLALTLSAQGGIQQAKIKKVQPDTSTLTLTVNGKDMDYTVLPETMLKGPGGESLTERLKDKRFKEGAAVMFKPATRGGKAVLLGLRFIPAGKGPGFKKAPPNFDSSGLKPLTELGAGDYQGEQGGLYPGGKNERPAAHEKAGRALGAKVQPLDAAGKPSADGKIVLLSVGMSNTTQVFSAFKRIADPDADRNPRVVIVDGAQGGMTAAKIKDPGDDSFGTQFWTEVDRRLTKNGVTRAQVQAAWIKEADAGPTQGFPRYAKTLQAELAQVVQAMHQRFPNLKLVYLSSRTFAGYATTRLNPEPYAYESGFSVRWLIEQQLKGEPALNYDPAKGVVRAPWLSWGPYLWANGMRKRADGFYYEKSDFAGDGTHPSKTGQQKVARELLRFFKTDSTTRPWFVARPR